MLELIFVAMFTVLPDYLVRRFLQDKRIGREITLFSVWNELRYGLTACAIVTLSLITLVFYYHPSTRDVTSYFRTVTILPERPGRVKEVFVENNQHVNAGDLIFSLEDDQQRADVATAKAKIAEIEALMAITRAELAAAAGTVGQARASLKQTRDELAVQMDLFERGSGAASRREVERLQNLEAKRRAGLEAAIANHKAVETKLNVLLPAQRASAEAALHRAQTALDLSEVRASVDGEILQFALQPGDIVNPILRPAGILVPAEVNKGLFTAGFAQVSTQVLKVGMIGEVSCMSLPYRIIPVRVTKVQSFLPAGQFRPSDQLVDVQNAGPPSSVMVTMQPLAPDSAVAVPRGSRCIANVYTNNHDRLERDDLSTGERIFLHAVDTVGLVHALLLRVQVFLMPVQTLVLSGH